MYVFNKEGIKNKNYILWKEKKVGLTYRWLLQKVIRSFVDSDPEKKYFGVWLGPIKFKINLIKFT